MLENLLLLRLRRFCAKAWNCGKAPNIGELQCAGNSTSVSFFLFPSKNHSASIQILADGCATYTEPLLLRIAVQKGMALRKDYHATVTNCPART